MSDDTYNYSAQRVTIASQRAPRWRGRCSCGRRTFQHYSTKAAALTAIRRIHNEHTESEEHRDGCSRTANA